MTSKEYIQGVLYNLKETLKFAEETNNKDLEFDCEMQIESYNQVLKDLEVLEILKEYLTSHILEELCIEEKEVWEWLENEK